MRHLHEKERLDWVKDIDATPFGAPQSEKYRRLSALVGLIAMDLDWVEGHYGCPLHRQPEANTKVRNLSCLSWKDSQQTLQSGQDEAIFYACYT